MDQEKIVVGIGEALWDVLPEGKKIGGAPANFAYHVSQLGLSSCVVSAVGEDALGSEILANFSAKGLCTHIATVPYPTGTVQVEIDQVGVPQYVIRGQYPLYTRPRSSRTEDHRSLLRLSGTEEQRLSRDHQPLHR